MSLHWIQDDGAVRSARWVSDGGTPAPRRVVPADSRIGTAAAYRHICEGTALLWTGDFPSARQLLTSLGKRAEPRRRPKADSLTEAFHLQRREQARRTRILSLLLVPYEAGEGGAWTIPLKRAPEVAEACAQAYGEFETAGDAGEAAEEPDSATVVGSLRELLGVVGAYEWRRKGVVVPALGGDRIHPHYGVFSPVRGEYLDLAADAAKDWEARGLPPRVAFDVGTGTGVLAALLARHGAGRVVATDLDPRAVACARENADRLGVGPQVRVEQADLFPEGRADLIVCNPPWLPGRPRTRLDHAVYDPDSSFLHRFLAGLPEHLEPGGEAWLLISDLAERLGLRGESELADAIGAAGLEVTGRETTTPRHGRAFDRDDPLYEARSREITSLWRLAVR
ncbi:50S ribosomal protein L11 methyltransferase [Streptomyces indicus]|uniref:Ribosomal protein L11 methyltransferase (PrmA) n=1 Tax=Streptomyces indicus TaxID=417292 RepID=A0A1G8WL83_9ACTN|nr:class I SAM-dependent methyltransferase [Streptomyces indicus]SDJ78856.1 Ribosomal protein L11 methyltransferase (PrmA) [Streptomyces indicus]